MSRLADITDGSAGMGGNGNGGMGVEYVYMDRGMKEVPWATEMILQVSGLKHSIRSLKLTVGIV